MHGVISASSSDKEEVLHIEIMKKFCFVCYTNPTIGYKCEKNYERTGDGTEVAGVLYILVVLFISEVFCYTKYLGDGAAERTEGWLQGSPVIQTYL
jgi:hypothetical protein